MVLMSLERLVAVWMMLRAKVINTRRNALTALTAIAVVVSPYLVYVTYITDIVARGSCRQNWSNPMIQYTSVASQIIYSAVPSVVVVVVNLLVVGRMVSLQRAKRSRVAASTAPPLAAAVATVTAGGEKTAKGGGGGGGDQSQRVTVTMLLVTTVFVALVTPSLTVYVYENVANIDDSKVWIGGVFAQILDQMHHSVNFFIYVASSTRFRQRVVELCRRRCGRAGGGVVCAGGGCNRGCCDGDGGRCGRDKSRSISPGENTVVLSVVGSKPI